MLPKDFVASQSNNTTIASSDVKRRNTCRLCESDNILQCFQLTPTPPANAFVQLIQNNQEQRKYPLDIHLCQSCGHLQMLDVVDPALLFENYVYVSGTSPVFIEHFRQYAATVMQLCEYVPNPFIVEIGSNDGTLLQFFQKKQCKVLGIDPAKHIAEEANAKGIETLPVFFTSDIAQAIYEKYGTVDIVIANNVFAHIDNLSDVTQGISRLLVNEGVFIFEVSYLLDVINKTLFDTIYHEHLSYHAVKPLQIFFRRHGLELFHVQRIETHGGSIRCFVKKQQGQRPILPSVEELIAIEEQKQLFSVNTFVNFANTQIQSVKEQLGNLLETIVKQGKSIAGFGAPAKATTLLYHFNLGHLIDFIVDESPWKQGMLTPGFHIPVVSAQALYELKPDYVIVLAWNFASSIVKKHHEFLLQGGTFIVPLPIIKVISS